MMTTTTTMTSCFPWFPRYKFKNSVSLFKGLFIWARLTGLARFPKSRLTSKSFVNFRCVHMRGPGSVTEISVFPTRISVSWQENFAIWTLHPGYRDEFFATAHALNGRWLSSAVSSHIKAARMVSFYFAWWIFHIISNPFNCSDTVKRAAKAMIGAK